MNTLVNPTADQIKEFCRVVEQSLLAALERGSSIELGSKQKTKDVTTPEYGQTPVDALYVGATFKAKFRERGF